MIKISDNAIEIRGSFSKLMAETTTLLEHLRKTETYSEKEMDEFFQQAVELSKMDQKQLVCKAIDELGKVLANLNEEDDF